MSALFRSFDAESRRTDKNIYTQSHLRFLGFANDVGEALKTFLPRPVYLGSYAVTAAYVWADTYYTRQRAIDAGRSDSTNKAADALIWHTGATLITTPLIVHALKEVALTCGASKKIAAVVGLLVIPFIVPPVDHLYHELMNLFRKEPVTARHWGIYGTGH